MVLWEKLFRKADFGLFRGLLGAHTCCLTSLFISWLVGRSALSAKLEGVGDEPESCAAIQQDLNRLGNGPTNLMKFNEEKYQVLHLGRNGPIHQDRLWIYWLEGTLQKKTWGSW